MKPLLAAVLVSLSALGPAAAQDAASDHWDARITSLSGAVVVHPADGSAEVDASVGMPLEEGDRVVTLTGATADLSLDGGSLIALRENSDFKLEKTAKAESVFALTFGSLLAKIQKLGSQRLSVRTAGSVASVRGTEFGVDFSGGKSDVGVFDEGRVEVSGGAGMEVLTPNQETSVVSGQAPLKASPLKHFAARRARMLAVISRLARVRANWRSFSSSERRAARMQFLRDRRAERELRMKNREERDARQQKKP